MISLRVGWLQFGGLLVALLGFAITRVFVAEALDVEATVPFLIAGILPLVIGLGLTVYGVALAVGAFSDTYVATVTIWSLIGTATMVVILVLSILDELVQSGIGALAEPSGLIVANVVLGGAVGGVLIGHRSAENARQRQELNRQSNRALFVNRLLKHEVINAATIIDGYAHIAAEQSTPDAVETIQSAVRNIEQTITDIGTIARATENPTLSERDVLEPLTAELDRIEAEHEVDIELSVEAADSSVFTGPQIRLVFRELLENAIEHGIDSSIAVEVFDDGQERCIAVHNEGPSLPDRQRRLLEEGSFPEFDDPTAGFGFQLVQLLVDQYNGRITVTDADRTTITVRLPTSPVDHRLPTAVGVGATSMYAAGVAGIVAGVIMGILLAVAAGMFPVIGALYGIEDPIVGWVTHLFHSVVFALMFVTFRSRFVARGIEMDLRQSSLLGVGWGVVLWLFAAGVVMPLWLDLVGISAPLPNLTGVGLVGHLVWGIAVAASFHAVRWVATETADAGWGSWRR